MQVVKVPASQGGLEKSGSEKAPDIIVEELSNIWSNTKGVKPSYDVVEMKLGDETDIPKLHKLIFDSVKEKNSIFIGGDHSVTYSLFKAFASANKNAGLVVFDAHPDVFHQFDFATHGDWLKFLVDEKIVNPENIMVIGIRNSDRKELDYLKDKKIKYIPMHKLFNNVEDSCDAVMEFANKLPSFYLSIDIDVVDPAFAPGTGYTEPCGLTSNEILYFVQRLRLLKNLRAADIVEVNPQFDANRMTSKLAAKLVAELL